MRRRIPDWLVRAVRLGPALFLFGLATTPVLQPYIPHFREDLQDEMQRCAVWAATTVVVTNGVLIGRVTQSSFERSLGTVLGGALGFLVWDYLFSLSGRKQADGILLSVTTGIVGMFSCYMELFTNTQAANFFIITFITVVFSAHNSTDDSTALKLACMRTGAILAAVILMQVFSVLLLPHSASVGCIRDLEAALKLVVSLHEMVWRDVSSIDRDVGPGNGYPAAPSLPMIRSKSRRDGLRAPLLSGSAAEKGAPIPITPCDRRALRKASEQALAAVYAAVLKAEDKVPLAQGEIYVWHFWGSYLFLPGLPKIGCIPGMALGSWRLPVEEVTTLATLLRRSARLLWTLHLDFERGFDSTMREMLQRCYPSGLLSDLGSTSGAALRDLLAALPRSRVIQVQNLEAFGQHLATLVQTSDRNHQELIAAMLAANAQRKARWAATTQDVNLSNVTFVNGDEGNNNNDGAAPPLEDKILGRDLADSFATAAEQEPLLPTRVSGLAGAKETNSLRRYLSAFLKSNGAAPPLAATSAPLPSSTLSTQPPPSGVPPPALRVLPPPVQPNVWSALGTDAGGEGAGRSCLTPAADASHVPHVLPVLSTDADGLVGRSLQPSVSGAPPQPLWRWRSEAAAAAVTVGDHGGGGNAGGGLMGEEFGLGLPEGDAQDLRGLSPPLSWRVGSSSISQRSSALQQLRRTMTRCRGGSPSVLASDAGGGTGGTGGTVATTRWGSFVDMAVPRYRGGSRAEMTGGGTTGGTTAAGSRLSSFADVVTAAGREGRAGRGADVAGGRDGAASAAAAAGGAPANGRGHRASLEGVSESPVGSLHRGGGGAPLPHIAVDLEAMVAAQDNGSSDGLQPPAQSSPPLSEAPGLPPLQLSESPQLGAAGGGGLPSNAADFQLPDKMFPATAEGHLSQVRWAAFQFVVEQLAADLEETFIAVAAVLDKLPHPLPDLTWWGLP